MDPSMFLQYSPPTGLPQESKLATYMSRSTSTPTRSLNQAMSNLSMESSPTAIKKMLIGEFVPINYFNPPPMPLPPESPQSSPPNPMVMPPINTQVHQENVGGTTYFYSTNPDSMNAPGLNVPPLNPPVGMVPEGCIGVPSAYASQMYAGVPAHLPPMPAQNKPGLAATFYTPETIRSEIYQRNEDVFLQPDIQLPETVEMYAELTPLEGSNAHSLATSYRATHRVSGEHYALRRLHACAAPPALLNRIEAWRNVDHPNVVRLHHCFTTKDFGDHSVVLVYDYHPACMTLMTKYLATGAPGGVTDGNGAFHDPFSSDPDAPRPYTHQKNAMLRAVACGALLPEAVLWSLLVQLTAGLRAIHTAGLACRSLDATKVVMNGCRIRIAWGGIADVIHNSNVDITQAQQEDMTALGRLALGMACRTVHCDNLNACMDLVARSYSADLKNLILYLLSATTRRSVTDLMPMIGARFYTQVEALERRADAFEEQLAREIDNGRLLRILIKMGVVNERPELNLDASWSETGDRYMLKLFRDYLFHSVTADGRPWLDQAHLASALNSLDGGSLAKVELMSRDEQSVLVVSYSELKHCLEAAFEEVMQAAGAAP
ncbi:PAN2-PAN3 deadenylation complex subunit PAN3 isoform X9 [Vanessa tameamea]|uniref:PAN2-PAN3 deadenylation complex subunit PAN3 n=1 Tax=Vanessa tameamea TaxID=334116 RepID=A0A8B8ITI5_VANTA|nr:PAN2-PAN3 deadenylation complex subunit PAN3 isoform X9 [Vanessa tameamea]